MASANKLAQIQTYDADANVVAALALPTTCKGVIRIKLTDATYVYHAFGTGAPGTDYNNLDNGSLYTDLTNFKLHIKTAAATWVVVGSQT